MPETAVSASRPANPHAARLYWSGADLSERLRVTPRTVRRDVDRLRQLGYTIDARRGTAGRYRPGFGTGIPPLLLDGDEAVAVALALRDTTAGGLAGIEEASLQALIKLEQSLPAMLRRRVDTLQRIVIPLTGPGPIVAIDTLMTVASAARDTLELRIDYTSHKGTRIRHLVELHRVVHVGALWYLVAWDTEKEAWRTYRLDRLSLTALPGRRIRPRAFPDDDVTAYVAAGITMKPYPHRCRITVLAPADVVGDLIGPTRGTVRAITDSTREVIGGSVSLQEMALWIARLDLDVIVHEPPELAEQLTTVADPPPERQRASGCRDARYPSSPETVSTISPTAVAD